MWRVKNEIKTLKAQDLIEENNVWALLIKILNTYQLQNHPELPYDIDEIKELQHSVFKWVYSLKIFDHGPENYKKLAFLLKTGNVLYQIVNKITKTETKLLKFPSNKKECLQNIENVLALLRNQKNMSKKFVFDSLKIYNSDQTYILGLLEDLHRFAYGLPIREIGEKYHQDGPFFGKFKQNKVNLSKIEEKSFWNSAFISPSRNENISKSLVNSRYNSPFTGFSTNKNFNEPSIDTISPKQKQPKTENLSGFEWLASINLTLPSNLNLQSEKISEFRSGELICHVLSVLEARTIVGVQKARKKSAEAAKNLSLAFDILRSKPSFSYQVYHAENYILDGNGYYVRLLLKEIYRIYKNSIVTLIKFRNSKHY